MSENPWDVCTGDYFSWHFRQTVFMKFMLLDADITRDRIKAQGFYWKCDYCGAIKFKEEEILCWKCGIGEMIYRGETHEI